MTDTITFQNINPSSWITLFIPRKSHDKTKKYQRELHNSKEITFVRRKQIRYQCSGIWRRVDWFIDTNISEELAASIFKSV